MVSKLKKELKFLAVFSLAAGAMISSGIFILPGIAFAQAGPSVFMSYVLAGIVALMGIFSIVELSTAMPKAGGDCFYITRTLGPLMGTVSGIWSWFAISLKTAFAIFGIAEILFLTFKIPVAISSPLICLFFVLLNLAGVKEAAKLEVSLVLGLLALMLGYVFAGIPRIEESVFIPFMPHGVNSTFETAGIVFISFGGLLSIASVSEEIHDPKKNIPSGIIAAVVIVTILYGVMLFVTVGVLPHAQLSGSLTPIADTARVLMGKAGYTAISIAALLAFITTANAGIMSASRYPLVLSEDALLPPQISKVSKKRGTPYAAVILTGIVVLVALSLELKLLVEAGSTVILATSILANIAVIVLRASKIQNYRPSFVTPFYPWPQVISTILFMLFILRMGHGAIEVSLLISVVAVAIFLFYGRGQKNREFALLHILERITNKEITSSMFEDELREILHSRDETKFDRLHKAIQAAEIHDLTEEYELDAFIDAAAQEISGKYELKKEKVRSALKKEIDDIGTVIPPFCAIPHVIIPGENTFEICIARCKDGIKFSKEEEPVKAVFLIAVSEDGKKYLFKTFALIAQMIQDKSFERLWMSAKTTKELRDILLLSDRTRG